MTRNTFFVGSFVSFEDSKLHPAFSQAGNLFQRKFIDFLEPEKVVSLIPVFINTKRKFNFDKPILFVNNQSCFSGAVNKFYKLAADTLQVCHLIAKSKKDTVFFYNIDKHNFLMLAIVRFILQKRTYVIVADYAQYRSKFVNWFFSSLLRASHGCIVLNSNIVCNDNSKTLLGLLYDQSIYMNTSASLKKSVFFSGSLSRTTGFELVLDCFSNLPDYKLYITGRPFRYTEEEFQYLLDKYVTPNENIEYLGLLSYDDYCNALNECDVALSLRNPGDSEHQYNFPSKILEYLSNSKLVISSVSYQDLPAGILFETGFDINSLRTTLHEVFSMPQDAFVCHRRRVYEYLKTNFSQKNAVSIIEELCEK